MRDSFRHSIITAKNRPLTISCHCILIKEINLTQLKKLRELEMSNTEWISLG